MSNLPTHPEYYNPNFIFDGEEFRKIPGHNSYFISNLGRLLSLKSKRDKILRPYLNNRGYIGYYVRVNNTRKSLLQHRAIALSFIENPNSKPIINHKNGIKTDNRIDNIEWCTHAENHKHAYETGLKVKPFRSDRRIKVFSKNILSGNVTYFRSQREAANSVGLMQSKISECCNTIRQMHGGFLWSFSHDEFPKCKVVEMHSKRVRTHLFINGKPLCGSQIAHPKILRWEISKIDCAHCKTFLRIK